MKHGGLSKRKVNKSVKRHMSAVRPMAKRRVRRYRARARGFIRRHKPKRLSIMTMLGMGTGIVASFSDRASIFESVQHGIKGEWGWNIVARDVFVQTTGYDIYDHKWYIPTFTAALVGGVMASKILNKFVPASTFDAIPFIGKKIKL
jgi:hypothetical protein